MEKSPKKIWFEGAGDIQCVLKKVEESIQNIGEYYAGIVRLMPGMSQVELIESGDDFIIIQTNEGLMKRTNIHTKLEPGKIVLEFDEEYRAGKMLTTHACFLDEYTTSGDKIRHRTVISDLKAPGFMGFLLKISENPIWERHF